VVCCVFLRVLFRQEQQEQQEGQEKSREIRINSAGKKATGRFLFSCCSCCSCLLFKKAAGAVAFLFFMLE